MQLRRVRILVPVAILAGLPIALQARDAPAPARPVTPQGAAASAPARGTGLPGGARSAGASGSPATSRSAVSLASASPGSGPPAPGSGGSTPGSGGAAGPGRAGGSGSSTASGFQSSYSPRAHVAEDPTVNASVSLDYTGQALPASFVGTSIEYPALHIYTGRDPRHVDPVLIRLLDALAPGHSPILRIGGNSADQTWFPVRGVLPPKGAYYGLGSDWLATARALALESRARLILGINFAGDRPGLAGTEARALLRAIGRRHLEAFEIGNEPDLYGAGGWYKGPGGNWVYARPPSWDMQAMISDYARWRANLPAGPIVGPSLAELVWLNQLGSFISAEPDLRMVTVHRYPLRGCEHDATTADYPTIPNLLADSSSEGLAQSIASYVSETHSAHLPFRVDEMNSVACKGIWGISDTFASALWALDTLYNMAAVGVDGVNFHMLPTAAYELFSPAEHGSRWSAFVRPEYYGLLFFTRGFPAGAHLLQVSVPSGPVKVYATRGRDGHVRVTLINKDPQNPVTVNVQIQYASGSATLQRLSAPLVTATRGVTIAGQGFGSSTRDGRLRGKLRTVQVQPDQNGVYSISLPAASAALLTR